MEKYRYGHTLLAWHKVLDFIQPSFLSQKENNNLLFYIEKIEATNMENDCDMDQHPSEYWKNGWLKDTTFT